MSAPPTTTSYDEIPYESTSFEQTHPNRLATLGRLFGMCPQPVDKCRVLEIGCAGGDNLIPMAFHLPGSSFWGVDLSRHQIDMARQTKEALGLNNIHLRCTDLMNVTDQWGAFDYIICHGVYSWVKDSIQDKILSICSRNLAPNGIAYISYNTYPGWHIREMVRRMMLFHTEQFSTARERIEQARALIDFLAHSVPSNQNYFGQMLRSELDLVRRSRDAYLFHEHLEETNAPVYFYEFMKQARRHDLQYLGEAQFASMLTSGFPPEVNQTLCRISQSILHTEQYMDFLRNRAFRQTLLCHNHHKLRRNLNPEVLEGFLVASAVRSTPSQVDFTPGMEQNYQAPNGATVSVTSPLTKAALVVLREHWPQALPMDCLIDLSIVKLEQTNIKLNQGKQEAADLLAQDLLQCYTVSAIELHSWQADFVIEAGDFPKATAVSRFQAEREMPIVNQRHENVRLDRFSKALIELLDGSRNRSALYDSLYDLALKGSLKFEKKGVRLGQSNEIRNFLIEVLPKALRGLARLALLTA